VQPNPRILVLRNLRRLGGAALLLLVFGRLATTTAADTTNRAPVSVWDVTTRVVGGFGYRDNVLRSSVATENSAFFLSTADLTLIRLSETGSLLTLFLLGEDTRYFNAPSVGYEQIFSGSAQFTHPILQHGEVGGYASYLYQHQILDVSETESILQRVLVIGHGVTIRPHWKESLTQGLDLQLTGTALRQVYESQLDDYWEGSGRLSLIHSYARRSEFTGYYQFLYRPYDTREQFDTDGIIVPDTHLSYLQNEVGLFWQHYWDEARHWRTSTKVSYMYNQDNGSGYFDYNRLLFSEQLRWNNKAWEIRATARFGYYYYDVQEFLGEPRERSYVTVDVRVERRLGKHWLAYVETDQEWNMSNDPIDEYNVWSVSAGMGVEF